MLTAEDEADLIARWQNQDDAQALDRLLRAFEPLCVSRAKRWSTNVNARLEDLCQEARFGLLQAINRFDPAYKNRLAAYAVYAIEEALRHHVYYKDPVVRIPHNVRQRMMDGLAAAEDDSTVVDSRTAMRADTAKQLLAPAAVQSLDAPLTGESGDNDLEPIDLLEDDRASPEDTVLDERTQARRRAWLDSVLRAIPRREARVIEERYLTSETPPSLEEIGDRYGLSKERIRQIEQKALGRIQHARTRAERPRA